MFIGACSDALVQPDRSLEGRGSQSTQSGTGVRPEFTSPVYPSIALYIVYREYINQNPGIRHLSLDDGAYQRYVEKRLRQLYPDRGYIGMAAKAAAEYRRDRAAAVDEANTIRSLGYSEGCDPSALICDDGSTNFPVYEPDPSWEGQQEYPALPEGFVPSIQEEIDSLQLTQPEINELYYYESLASNSYRTASAGTGESLTRDDLIRLAAARRPPPGTISAQVNPVFVGVLIGTAVWAGYKIYRAQKSADRAFQKADEYFPTLNGADDKKDAFRHIFWNVQLRRWLTAGDAWYLSTRHEDSGAYDQYGNKYGDNPANSKVMDLHNNAIGHHYKYHHFRADRIWDRWNTDKWSRRVRDYVQDANNAAYIDEWNRAVPTLDDAWQRESIVPRSTYIYFR